jgi:RNA methyltransferase, TrmH family
MQTLTSRHNRLYKELTALKKDRGVMLLEGKRLVEDAISRGITPRMMAVSEEYLEAHSLPLTPDIVCSDKLFAGISETETPQGVLAFFEVPWARIEEIVECNRIIVLDRLQDPGNVGTIVRTAEAFGFSGMVIMEGTASPFSPKAVRSSMGSCLGIRIARCDIEDLKKIPHRIIALMAQGRNTLSSKLFESKVAICFGQEAGGISRELLAISHDTISISMEGRTESLNVAVTAGIVMACAAGVFRG